MYGTLRAALPTDDESVRLTRAFTGFYIMISNGVTYPDRLESLLATNIAAAREDGEVAAARARPAASA